MTRRRPPLTHILLRSVSHGALEWSLSLGTERAQKPSSQQAVAALGLLARLRIWLRLIFGGGTARVVPVPHEGDRTELSRHQRRTQSHRQKRHISARKHPAHDLETLMRFAPDSQAHGLTLNQYRARFTRLSVMGWVQIYHLAFRHIRLRIFALQKRQALFATSWSGGFTHCAAPLSPD